MTNFFFLCAIRTHNLKKKATMNFWKRLEIIEIKKPKVEDEALLWHNWKDPFLDILGDLETFFYVK